MEKILIFVALFVYAHSLTIENNDQGIHGTVMSETFSIYF